MRAQAIENGEDAESDDHDEVDGGSAKDLTDSHSEVDIPSSPKMPYSVATLTRQARSPVPSICSMQQQAGDTGTLSRARQMRMSQESTTMGRAVMQFNKEFKKESSPGRRKSSTPDRKSFSSLDGDDISSGTLRVRPAAVKEEESNEERMPKENV